MEIIHWIINPIFLFILLRLFFGAFRTLSFPFIFIISYLILIYIQSLNLYQNNIASFTYLITVWSIPYLIIFMSAFTMIIILKHKPSNIIEQFKIVKISELNFNHTNIIKLISLVFISIPIIYILDKGFQNVSFFYTVLNPGDSYNSMLLRIGGLNSNISSILTQVYSYGRTLLFPVYLAILIGLLINNQITKFHFIIVFLAGSFFSILTGAKSPLVIMLIVTLISYYFNKKGHVSKIKIAIVSFFALFIPSLMYPLLFGSKGAEVIPIAIENLWRRLTVVPTNTVATYFNLFPRVFEHLGFSSNRILAFLTNQDYSSSASLVYSELSNNSIEGGLVNSAYFASFYADYGLVGALGGTLFIGIILGALQKFFDNNKDILSIAVRAVVVVSIIQLMLTNFYSVALGRGFLSLPLLLFIVKTFVDFEDKSQYKKKSSP